MIYKKNDDFIKPSRLISIPLFIVILWVALCIMVALTSCSSKKAFEKYSAKHPEALAEKCLERFPSKETYIQGKTDTLISYETIIGDSIECPKVAFNQLSFVKCKDSKVIIKTLLRTDTINHVDSSALYLLNVQKANVISLNSKIKDLKHDKSMLYIWLIFLIIFIGINLYFKIKKYLP